MNNSLIKITRFLLSLHTNHGQHGISVHTPHYHGDHVTLEYRAGWMAMTGHNLCQHPSPPPTECTRTDPACGRSAVGATRQVLCDCCELQTESSGLGLAQRRLVRWVHNYCCFSSHLSLMYTNNCWCLSNVYSIVLWSHVCVWDYVVHYIYVRVNIC